MHTVEIPEANIKKYIPEHLGECNQEQYVNMCNLIFKEATKQITFNELKTHAVYYLLNMVPSNKVINASELSKFSNLSLLEDLVETFFENELNEDGEVVRKIIKQYYINNPIYKVRVVKNYYGPSDEFNNVKYGEYVDALTHFEDFHATGEVQYLHLLFATFYREKNTNNKSIEHYSKDKRINYNPDRVDQLAELFKKLDIGIIYGFYLLFASFKKYLTTAKIFIEGKEIDLSILYDDSKTIDSGVPGIGQKSTMFTIAESGIFGSLEKVRETPFWEIIVRIYDIRKRDLDFITQQESKDK